MGDKTKIEWTDATWNPTRGCSRVSEGCRNCYAETVANRFRKPGQPYEGLIAKGGQWNGNIRLVPEKLAEPLRWKRPRRIFVDSMSDLFHEGIPFEYIAQVFAVMGVTTRHTYQILTKRPARMKAFFDWVLTDKDGVSISPTDFDADDRITDAWPQWLPWDGYDNCGPAFPYKNVWMGVSVEDQATANERIPLLLKTPAAVRWVSIEPLLGPVDLREAHFTREHLPPECRNRVDWVVTGGESGPHARPPHPDWFRSLRDQCAAAGVPFLFKQWGEWAPGDQPAWPETADYLTETGKGYYHDGYQWMDRLGKKAAGRHLDGEIHDGFPEVRR